MQGADAGAVGQVGLGQQQRSAVTTWARASGWRSSDLQARLGVDHRHHPAGHHRAAVVGVLGQPLEQRLRLGDARGLEHDAVGPGPRDHLAQRLPELLQGAHLVADAAARQLDHRAGPGPQQLAVDVDAPQLVDDDRQPAAMLRAEDPVERRGFPAPRNPVKITSGTGGGDMVPSLAPEAMSRLRPRCRTGTDTATRQRAGRPHRRGAVSGVRLTGVGRGLSVAGADTSGRGLRVRGPRHPARADRAGRWPGCRTCSTAGWPGGGARPRTAGSTGATGSTPCATSFRRRGGGRALPGQAPAGPVAGAAAHARVPAAGGGDGPAPGPHPAPAVARLRLPRQPPRQDHHRDAVPGGRRPADRAPAGRAGRSGRRRPWAC